MIIPLSDVFTEVRDFFRGQTINAIETGCSFAWTTDNFNNLSTLNITSHLLFDKHSKLLSIDNNTENISRCLRELKHRKLDHLVEFNCGESISVMRDKLREGSRFNFFWLDSEESEEHGQLEYDLALALMSKPGVICIDDYGSTGSIKWKLSSKNLKLDSSFNKVYSTPTGLIVGFFNG